MAFFSNFLSWLKGAPKETEPDAHEVFALRIEALLESTGQSITYDADKCALVHVRPAHPMLLLCALGLGTGCAEVASTMGGLSPSEPRCRPSEDDPLRYPDADGDGFGDIAHPGDPCLDEWSSTRDHNDCDDQDAAINPDAHESCNDADDDCDGQIDEGLLEWRYLDADGDGWGSDERLQTCHEVEDYVDNSEDCDDSSAAIGPDQPEVCDDEIDNDCDSLDDCDDLDDCNSLLCDERCEDGRDNDADGLMDCEDGDCLDEDHCQEDCFDNKDNDVDGLEDCEDPDCAGEIACYEYTTTLHSADLHLIRAGGWFYSYNTEVPADNFDITLWLTLMSPWGTAVGPRPDTPSVDTTCTWQAASFVRKGRMLDHSFYYAPGQAKLWITSSHSLSWSSGCPIADLAGPAKVLPAPVYWGATRSDTVRFGLAEYAGTPVYEGRFTASTATSWSTVKSSKHAWGSRTTSWWGTLQGYPATSP